METADKLWTILSSLDNPGLSFYTESIAKGEDIKSFINLILDEKRARLNLAPTGKEAYIREMKRIIKERRKFFEMMLEITDEDIKDFRKSEWKWWLIGGVAATAAVVMGCWGIKKIAENKDKKK